VRDLVQPLIRAYLDPERFFDEELPRLDAPCFGVGFPPLSKESCELIRSDSKSGKIKIDAEQYIRDYAFFRVRQAVWTWGAGVLIWNRVARAAFDGLAPDRKTAILSVIERRSAYHEGRPPGTGVDSQVVQEVLAESREYVSDLEPRELAEDRSIVGDPADGPKLRRSPSREQAARKRAALDLGISTRTLRRRLKTLGAKGKK
jgi:DNA-binding protein Fis